MSLLAVECARRAFYGASQALFAASRSSVGRGRDGRAGRRQRRRQDHPAARDRRRAPAGRGRIVFEGRRRGRPPAHQRVARRDRARARGPAAVPRPDRRGEPAASRLRAAARGHGRSTRVFEPFPMLGAAARRAGRPVGRRAAGDRHRPGADDQPAAAAARRGLARAWPPSSSSVVYDVARARSSREGRRSLLVEQDLSRALAVADRVDLHARRPRRAGRPAERPDARPGDEAYFGWPRGDGERRPMNWINTDRAGRPARRLLRAVRLRPVADLRRHAASSTSRMATSPSSAAFLAWSCRRLGVDPLLALLLVLPVMAAVGYVLQRWCSTGCSAAACCRRCWSPSACRSSSRTACSRRSRADYAPAARRRGIETASLAARRRARHRLVAAAHLRRGASCCSAACSCCSADTALGRAFRATADDRETAALDRHRRRAASTRSPWRSPWPSSAVAGVVPRHPHRRSIRRIGPDPPALRLRGGGDRRPRLAVGHAGRRRHPRRGPDHRRPRRPGLGRADRASGLSGGAAACGPPGSSPDAARRLDGGRRVTVERGTARQPRSAPPWPSPAPGRAGRAAVLTRDAGPMRLLVEFTALLVAGPDVEPARRLRGPGVGRPAGLRRARRLRADRARRRSRRRTRSCRCRWPAWSRRLLALPTAALVFRLRRAATSRSAPGSSPRSTACSSPTPARSARGTGRTLQAGLPAGRARRASWSRTALALALGVAALAAIYLSCARAAAWG